MAVAVNWRSIAERLTHRLILRRTLELGADRVRIFVSSEGGLRYLRPNLQTVDPALLRVARETVPTGAIVWDIGANVGLFSFAAACLAGPTGYVLAVEPDTWLVNLLRRSASVNRRTAPVEVLPVAVSNCVGVGRLHVARRNRATNHLDGFGTTQTGGSRRTDIVPTVTLDWLLANFPPPNVVKIDVEAAEALVLAGATSLLRTRPTLICEVARSNAAVVRDLLRPLGYRLFDCSETGEHRTPVGEVPADLLAIAASGTATSTSLSGWGDTGGQISR